MKKLFFGGIHPADKKELTSGKETIRTVKPERVTIPLSQHIGVPCKPLVKVGDYVRVGQKIGDNEGLCAPVHASVSGTVIDIKPMPHPNGTDVPAIIIENDYQDTWHEDVLPQSEVPDLEAGELFQMIREAGIVGMGGATFPTEIKATSSYNNIDTLIVNACECEPYITADDTLMYTEPEKVLRGIEILQKTLQPKVVVLAIEDNKKKAIAALKKHVQKYPQIELRVLPTRYPQGAEKQLILAVTGREVPPGQLPASVDCAVFNVTTMAFICQAVDEGKPLVRRIVSVTGEGVTTPENFMVPIGTPFAALIEAAGGLKKDGKRVIAGGPMMGKAQKTLDVPVIKGTGSVLCLKEIEEEAEPKCIRCGKCVEVCPMKLQPLYMYRYQAANNLKMLDKFHLMDCMECGCCAYVCPGKLPLVESFRAGKQALKEGK